MKPYIEEPKTSRRFDLIDRIYAQCTVEDRGFETECYVYQGSVTGQTGRGAGYPVVSVDGQTVRAHRVVFMCIEGFMHSKRQVDHKCSVRRCVRYSHLQSVTQKQNCLLRDQKNGVKRRKRKRSSKTNISNNTTTGKVKPHSQYSCTTTS